MKIENEPNNPEVDVVLVKLDSATLALQECKTVMEAKEIADIASAARIYLARRHAAGDAVKRAAEIRTLAERQMGVHLRRMEKAKGGRPEITPRAQRGVNEQSLSDIGITYDESSRAQRLAAIPEGELRDRIEAVKAADEEPTPRKVLNFSAAAQAAGEEAASDTTGLWHTKSRVRRLNHDDQNKLVAWVAEGRARRKPAAFNMKSWKQHAHSITSSWFKCVPQADRNAACDFLIKIIESHRPADVVEAEVS